MNTQRAHVIRGIHDKDLPFSNHRVVAFCLSNKENTAAVLVDATEASTHHNYVAWTGYFDPAKDSWSFEYGQYCATYEPAFKHYQDKMKRL